MASLGWTVLDLMTSDISRLSGMSSLKDRAQLVRARVIGAYVGTRSYKLLLVALSICSSRAVLAEDDHQPPIILQELLGRGR